MTEVAARGLTKTFGRVTAVRDMTFTAPAGTITGFLGPNGSGKTTTLRMTLGLIRPTGGQALIGGVPYTSLAHPRRQVGALLEATGFHPGRRARDHLRVLAAAERIPDRRVDEVLGQVGLAGAAGRRVRGFSLGMRQRLGLAAALLGDPEVLLLDEPANGLDPGGHRLAPWPAPRSRRRGPHHRAGQSPAQRDHPDRRPRAHRQRRAPAFRGASPRYRRDERSPRIRVPRPDLNAPVPPTEETPCHAP